MLLLAADKLVKQIPFINFTYFPAHELLNDELRAISFRRVMFQSSRSSGEGILPLSNVLFSVMEFWTSGTWP